MSVFREHGSGTLVENGCMINTIHFRVTFNDGKKLNQKTKKTESKTGICKKFKTDT